MKAKFNKYCNILLIALCVLLCGALVLAVLGVVSAPEVRDYDAFLEALADRESSGNYRAENRYGYLGRYQMGEKALQDAGFLDGTGAWTDLAEGYGIDSESDFLESKAGQDAAVRAYHRRLCRYISRYGLEEYLGREYQGVEVTESGLLAACHLVGARSLQKALEENAPVTDGNRVEASEYMELFSGFDIAEVWS